MDDHDDPVVELARLHDLLDFYLTASTDEEKVFLMQEQKREVDERVRALGFAGLQAWIDMKSFGMRADPAGDWLDAKVLGTLREGSVS